MKSITLLTAKNLEDYYIYDDDLLVEELEKKGFLVSVMPWEDLEDKGQDLFIIRTTWNYTDYYEEFIKKLTPIKERLMNPLPLVEWNANKRYLFDLYAKGHKVIPSQLVYDTSSLKKALIEMGGEDFIIKPLMSASAKGLQRFNSKDKVPELEGQMILQKFLPEIYKGEISLIYFSGEFAYGVKKVPQSGDFRVQEEYGGKLSPYVPSEEELLLSQQIIKEIHGEWLYARVDIVPGHGVIELECIEPSLYFSFSKNGAQILAQAIEDHLV